MHTEQPGYSPATMPHDHCWHSLGFVGPHIMYSTFEAHVCCQCAPEWLFITIKVRSDTPELTETLKNLEQEHPIYKLIPVIMAEDSEAIEPNEESRLRIIQQ